MLEHTGLGSVLPGRGLGAVRLGMRRADVRASVGEPLCEAEQDADGDARMEYHGGAHLFFGREQGFRLTLILLEEPGALTLCGVPIARVSEREALVWLGNAKHTVRETEFLDQDGETAVEREHSFGELGITLYADGAGRLTGCAIFVVIDPQDCFQWPDGQ